MYKVKLESFQGPLDLLYKMVKKNKIEINEISLANLTEQYLEYTNYFQSFELEVASEFMVIASQLIELKARTLLPENKYSEEEEEDEVDIVKRLQEYEFFKNISEKLQAYKKEADMVFFRPPEMVELMEDDFQLELDISPRELRYVFKKTLQDQKKNTEEQKDNKLNYIKVDQFKVEDKMEEIINRLKKEKARFLFSDFLNNQKNLLEIVVTLLSLLELIKLKKIRIKQEKLFSDIKITLISGRGN